MKNLSGFFNIFFRKKSVLCVNNTFATVVFVDLKFAEFYHCYKQFLLLNNAPLSVVGNPSTAVWNPTTSKSSAPSHRSVLRQRRRRKCLVHFHGICSRGSSFFYFYLHLERADTIRRVDWVHHGYFDSSSPPPLHKFDLNVEARHNYDPWSGARAQLWPLGGVEALLWPLGTITTLHNYS